MPSIFETIGLDGVIRATLTELLNNIPTPLYPATHSDHVYYKETSVEAALNDLYNAHSKLSALLKETRADLSTFQTKVYGNFKDYVDELLTAIYTKLSSSFVELTKLSIIIHSLSTYTKEDIDQKFSDFEANLTSSVTTLTGYYQQLTTYLTTNYDDKTVQEEKIEALRFEVDSFSTTITNRFAELLKQFKAESSDQIVEALEAYYTKSEVDQIKVTQDDEISIIKGDIDLMNRETAADLKDHLSVLRERIIDGATTEIKTACVEIAEQAKADKLALESKLDALTSALTSVANKVADPADYQNADEVSF